MGVFTRQIDHLVALQHGQLHHLVVLADEIGRDAAEGVLQAIMVGAWRETSNAWPSRPLIGLGWAAPTECVGRPAGLLFFEYVLDCQGIEHVQRPGLELRFTALADPLHEIVGQMAELALQKALQQASLPCEETLEAALLAALLATF